MESYKELNKRQQQEFNDFSLIFAYTQTQLMEAMHARGLDFRKDMKKLVRISSGGFVSAMMCEP